MSNVTNKKYFGKKAVVMGSAAILIASSTGVYAYKEGCPPKFLEIYVFQLSDSLSVFLRTPDDMRILINGGPNSEIIRHITSILPFYSRRIDAVIAADTQVKNISGLIDVIERYDVSSVAVPGITGKDGEYGPISQAYAIFLNSVLKSGTITRELIEGDILHFGEVEVSALFPAVSDSFAYSKASSPEVVLRISYGSTSVIFLGSATPKIQRYLKTDRSDLVIMSRNAASNIAKEFVSITKPRYLVHSAAVQEISSRAESSLRKGVPKAAALTGIPLKNVVNTKENKKTVFISDGESLWLE